ncbi:hypothetical protein R6Q59_003943 [Mikania micrantha]
MIPLFPVDEPCPICRKVCLDKFGEHAVHCKELPGFKYRHDLVRDVLCDVLKQAGISAKKEAPVNFLSDPCEGMSTLRPTDILVFGWSGIIFCIQCSMGEVRRFGEHQPLLVFTPFAFDTFGSLAPDVATFLKRVQQVVHSNSSTPKNANFVFSRIGFVIQKGLAAQLVARLPSFLLQLDP